MSHPDAPPPIHPIEFAEEDFDIAERIAKKLGYTQTAYTSTSALWGLFCLKDNPAHAPLSHKNRLHYKQLPPYAAGCIIKTREFGFLFVQDVEDLNLSKSTREHAADIDRRDPR